MKKLITLIFLLFIPLTSLASAPLNGNTNTENSDIVASVESGTYDKVIDLKLIPNDDGAKVFYYTDKVGRFDEQIEYKLGTTITIKKNTTLDYYSASRNETASLIKENTYTFNYPKNINLSYSDNAIIITNNENKAIDLRGWKIKGNEFLYPTIINSKDTYKYNYPMNDGETINLVSPDEKVNINFTYNIPKKVISLVKREISEKTSSSENTTNNETNPITETGVNTNTASSGNTNESVNTGNIETSGTNETGVTDNTLNNNLKTSILDSKKEKKTNPLVLIIGIIMFLAIAGGAYMKLEKK
ncbi:MAG: hypothetical protein PHG82_05330 [Candidatus Gracilibacteria bacterium]|nr:hypothetical protein [Candidatus Gracilibacteria bacterium]